MKVVPPIYDKLKNMKKPDDLVDTPILNDVPSELKLFSGLTPEEQSMIACSKKCFQTKKPVKKTGKTSMWDVDISSTGPGHFDEAGNFILNKSKKIPILWLVKRNGMIDGPFTEKEIKAMHDKGELSNSMIKREFDAGFVEYEKLCKEFPNFYYGANLSKFFVENQVLEQKEAHDDFYSVVVTKDRNSKLSNFMKKFNINAGVEFIKKNITGMRKADAIDAIADITGLDKSQNEILIDLIVEESDSQILKDVDKDGFESKTSHRSKRYFPKGK